MLIGCFEFRSTFHFDIFPLHRTSKYGNNALFVSEHILTCLGKVAPFKFSMLYRGPIQKYTMNDAGEQEVHEICISPFLVSVLLGRGGADLLNHV